MDPTTGMTMTLFRFTSVLEYSLHQYSPEVLRLYYNVSLPVGTTTAVHGPPVTVYGDRLTLPTNTKNQRQQCRSGDRIKR
jgi:hypothetical protein